MASITYTSNPILWWANQTDPAPNVLDNVQGRSDIPRFDIFTLNSGQPANSVDVRVFGSFTRDHKAENTTAGYSKVYLDHGNNLESQDMTHTLTVGIVSGGACTGQFSDVCWGLDVLEDVVNSSGIVDTVQPFDGTVDFLGVSAVDVPITVTNFDKTVTYVPPQLQFYSFMGGGAPSGVPDPVYMRLVADDIYDCTPLGRTDWNTITFHYTAIEVTYNY